ncbi:hypothetical protein [Sulfitobacter sp.]|uniref:hypothetical protein n=1 Tax=Sulfitobacter sp. TaxID=1903071 RepID=UPI0030024187
MKNQIISLALIASLAACGDGNPFETDEDTTTTEEDTTTDDTGTGITRDGIPPGTVSANTDDGIFRSEPTEEDGGEPGDGFAEGLTYNSLDDSFTVDNLAFDGDSAYIRGVKVSSLSPNPNNLDANNEPIGRFNVYEAPIVAADPVNEFGIPQLGHRAVYGVSRNRLADGVSPTTQFAIVRTGDYVNYGFGGFIYQRDNGVTLPSSLQATFRGHSAGLRDSDDSGELLYSTADVYVDIDFDDFNDGDGFLGDGVKGSIYNRRLFDLNGEDVTDREAALIGQTTIPNVGFEIGPDVLDANGEILTNVFSIKDDRSIYEEGTFYAILAGDDPDEIVGVFVLESTDLDTRDTGGFIVYRDFDTEE